MREAVENYFKDPTLGEEWINSTLAIEELRQYVLSSPINEIKRLKEWVENCQKDENNIFLRSRWDRLFALVWSGHQLINSNTTDCIINTEVRWTDVKNKLDNGFPPESNFAFFTTDCLWYWQGYLGQRLKSVEGFRLVCERTRPVTVPIAVEHPESGSPSLAYLELEVACLPSEGKQNKSTVDLVAGRHPEDFQGLFVDNNFFESMECAFRAALQCAGTNEHTDGFAYRGWWKLHVQPGLDQVSGRSASGAAALGWYHALQKTVPDGRILVLSAISRENSENGALEYVDGIEKKVLGLGNGSTFRANDSEIIPIDTIVVASHKNEEEVNLAIQANSRLASIRVINLSNEGQTNNN
ncbi:MAG: hypothetical protein ACRERU_15210 [Methylococcales bacterium]